MLTAARQSPKLLVGVQIPPGTPNNLLGSSIGLGHCPFTAGRGVRFPYRVPYVSADTGIVAGRRNYSGPPGRGRVLTQQTSAVELLA